MNILLLGYCGANNTGSEMRIITILEDVQKAFPNANIGVASVNPKNTLKIIQETDKVKVVHLPFVFPLAVYKLTKSYDLTLLVEGSTFKDNWSSALLYLFLWGAWCANKHGNYCIPYAVDAGKMSKFNSFLTTKVANSMPLIITRTQQAKNLLQTIGVKSEIIATTDTAFLFEHNVINEFNEHDKDNHKNDDKKIVGIAPVEFYQWPVKVKLFGKKDNCYNWPYYFSWTEEKKQKSSDLIQAWVKFIEYTIDKYDYDIQLTAMEELDVKICNNILSKLDSKYKQRIITCYAGEYTPQDIVRKLRKLDYLVTSRYHACVLSMESKVPQMCVYHDERLESIYAEIGLDNLAIKYNQNNLYELIQNTFDNLVQNSDEIHNKIKSSFDNHFIPKSTSNHKLLRDWADKINKNHPNKQIFMIN